MILSKPLLIQITGILLCALTCCTPALSQCEVDTLPPLVQSVNLSSAVLGSDCPEVELYAVDFFFFGIDDCTSSDSLRYTFDEIEPDADPNYQPQYRSSSMVLNCQSVEQSPVSISVSVWDLAGNHTTKTIPTTVISPSGTSCQSCVSDTIAPEVSFLPALTWIFDIEADITEVWASDFVASACDPCTANSALQYSFTDTFPDGDLSAGLRTFTCEEAMTSPIIPLMIYVWDMQGNRTVGETSLDLQLPFGHECPPAATEISGTFTDITGHPLSGIEVFYWIGESVYDSTTTNAEGQYTFTEQSDDGYLSAVYTTSDDVEINVLDLITMQNHLLGLSPLRPAAQLAADIDVDGSLRVRDLVDLRKYLLGITAPTILQDHPWRFGVLHANGTALPMSTRVALSEVPNPSFVAYRIGDVR